MAILTVSTGAAFGRAANGRPAVSVGEAVLDAAWFGARKASRLLPLLGSPRRMPGLSTRLISVT
jgi:hypothetical protein